MYCDDKSLTTTKCDAETEDTCTYTWKQGAKTETSECVCNYDGSQTRSCPAVIVPAGVTATPKVHTMIRFKEQTLKEAAAELVQNAGSKVKSWWGSFVSFVKDVADGTTVKECIEEVINSTVSFKASALLVLFAGLMF